mmetsp:Transcript_9316/g.26803  ORF Transcript_9316/g.26803 Transcript_9316/m.26803 type:complete len:421 (-) Transcript_9316:112-1374(-)|eukprot:CAMPEP_0176039282 /NCGR_PEP_ID=MMETSP0120_2-20121206/19472_1 /TAXON_ID=160619 /ORGANISM="Kryptoperidinium foliaceum, Strain CCMP 1326" /LENGTH=420 /DNA_ID=CAMNT_0017372677 /DNA_START=238 /DNA_END=1500 /DNA_ORIENTATION=+
MVLRCFGIDRLQTGGFATARATDPITQRGLEKAANAASLQAQPWEKERFAHLKDVQDAANNHGKVVLVRDKACDGQLVAAKRMPTKWVRRSPADFNQQFPRAFEKPWVDIGLVRILNALQYPYACRLHGVFQSGAETVVATAFCSGGDLFDWAFRDDLPGPGLAREAQMRPIVAQLVRAVQWLHDLGVAHRDLSLENVVLERSGSEEHVKLIDFGMATTERTVRREARGKLVYQAPEVHTNRSVDCFLVDSFAIGVILFVMSVMDYPWASTQHRKCHLYDYVRAFGLRRYLTKRRLRRGGADAPLHDALSRDLVDLIEALLQPEPRKRACLGEQAFLGEVRLRRRPRAPAMAFLREDQGTVLLEQPTPSKEEEPVATAALASSTVSTFSRVSCESAGSSSSSASTVDHPPCLDVSTLFFL